MDSEAAQAFTDSLSGLKQSLGKELAKIKQPIPSDAPIEKYLQPSIFDNEEIKDLKGILQEVVDKL